MKFRFKITDGNTITFSEWYDGRHFTRAQIIIALRAQYPTAVFQIERAPLDFPLPLPPNSGPVITTLENDSNPKLGGNLKLQGFDIHGNIKSQQTLIDGGLL